MEMINQSAGMYSNRTERNIPKFKPNNSNPCSGLQLSYIPYYRLIEIITRELFKCGIYAASVNADQRPRITHTQSEHTKHELKV